MRVTIFVEGGGDRKDLKVACRKAFRILLERAGFLGRMPEIVACGPRGEALAKFRTALRDAGDDELPILLVDGERPMLPEHRGKPWSHLATAPDNWQRPEGATDDHAHLMVQCMESWFLADRGRLAAYFGQHFLPGSLPGGNDVEAIEKQRILDGLRDATRHCPKKRYDKGRHSFDILEGLDPARVEAASFHAKRLFDRLREESSG